MPLLLLFLILELYIYKYNVPTQAYVRTHMAWHDPFD